MIVSYITNRLLKVRREIQKKGYGDSKKNLIKVFLFGFCDIAGVPLTFFS